MSTDIAQPTYAVAIILSDNQELLFIERAVREGDNWSGQMAFPGGKKEDSDSGLEFTAMRETNEEVGIHLQAKDCLGGLLDIQLRKRGLLVPGTLCSFVFTSKETKFILDSNEVENAYWIPVAYLSNPKNIGEYIFQRENVKMNLPCIEFEGKKIWGLTFQLLQHFLGAYAAAAGQLK